MTQRHWLVWCLQLGWVGLLGWMGAIAFASSTLAQSRIVPDRTLSAESSIVTPNVQGLPRVEITGGAIRGANLFHSFSEFNVDAGRGAYFQNPNANQVLVKQLNQPLQLAIAVPRKTYSRLLKRKVFID